MTYLITTTGTSLLTNAARHTKKDKSEITDDDLRHYFEVVGLTQASAETNSLPKIVSPDDRVVFLHTATLDGTRCAKQIKHYLKSKGWKNLQLRELELEENEAQFEHQGLTNLVNTLIDEIVTAQRQGETVIINATGGFKAQIAYTTMVGTIFQIPVKYIYQNFKNPVTFPPLPITWNLDLLIEYDYFFSWIDDEPRLAPEVEKNLRSIPNRLAIEQLLLPPNDTNEVFLSPAGNILWQRLKQQRTFPVEEPPNSEILPSDKIANSLKNNKHHFPKGTKQLAKRIADLSPVEEIIGGNFENTTFSRIKTVSDDGIIRILWADDQKATNLTIRTTAKGQAQAFQFAEKYIKPMLS